VGGGGLGMVGVVLQRFGSFSKYGGFICGRWDCCLSLG